MMVLETVAAASQLMAERAGLGLQRKLHISSPGKKLVKARGHNWVLAGISGQRLPLSGSERWCPSWVLGTEKRGQQSSSKGTENSSHGSRSHIRLRFPGYQGHRI